MTILSAAPGGDTDTIGIIPNGILPAVDEQPCAIGAIAFLQERRVILQRLVLHKIGTDNQTAVLVIEADAQGFVNYLLGKLGLGEKGLLLPVLFRRDIAAVHEGNLLVI